MASNPIRPDEYQLPDWEKEILDQRLGRLDEMVVNAEPADQAMADLRRNLNQLPRCKPETSAS